MTTPEMQRERALEKAVSDALARLEIAEANEAEMKCRLAAIKVAARVILEKCDG